MTLSEELSWRGFVNQTTFGNNNYLDGEPINFYWGVDPSAPSMTVGNLATAMMVRHFIDYGHKAVLLVGGATGMIGDPDGKATERELKSMEELQQNRQVLAEQYRNIFGGQQFKIVDNYDWFKDIGYLDFLRDVGKHMPMSQMLDREFVKARLGEEGSGISYAEFSYALIQGYDFLHLYRQYGVTLQVCGSDQWGNSIAGVDLIRRIEGAEAHVWSTPLVINKATNIKFGKSEAGAIWLNPQLTTPYKFYQFWLNSDDESVDEYLKKFTLLSKEEIDQTMEYFSNARSERLAQKRLAYEVTKIVHGHETADSVQKISQVLFGGDDYSRLNAADFEALKMELPVVKAKLNETSLVEILVTASLASSNSEARHFLTESAVYINGLQFSSEKQTLDDNDVVAGHVVIRRGKNSLAVVEV